MITTYNQTDTALERTQEHCQPCVMAIKIMNLFLSFSVFLLTCLFLWNYFCNLFTLICYLNVLLSASHPLGLFVSLTLFYASTFFLSFLLPHTPLLSLLLIPLAFHISISCLFRGACVCFPPFFLRSPFSLSTSLSVTLSSFLFVCLSVNEQFFSHISSRGPRVQNGLSSHATN